MSLCLQAKYNKRVCLSVCLSHAGIVSVKCEIKINVKCETEMNQLIDVSTSYFHFLLLLLY